MTAPATNAARTDDVWTPGLQLKVKWESGKLSLDAEAVPLSEVLLEVSRATGIEITGAEGLSNLVSMHLAGVELFQALRDLLLHVDYAFSVGPQGPASPRGTRIIILGRSSPESSSATPVTESETDAAIANQPTEIDQQTLMSAAPDESKDPDTPASAGAVQSPTQNADDFGPQASSENLPGIDVQPDASQTEKLAAIEAAATSQDSAALGKYMQDANATVQAAAFNALAALDNPAAVQNLTTDINDASQPDRLQALQILSQSPQADEQTVMTALIDALNGADPSLSAYAAQALAERGTPEAMNALSEMLNSSDPSTRLTVLQSVAQTEAGRPLLSSAALSDSNEMVRSAAAALLQQGEATTNP